MSIFSLMNEIVNSHARQKNCKSLYLEYYNLLWFHSMTKEST